MSKNLNANNISAPATSNKADYTSADVKLVEAETIREIKRLISLVGVDNVAKIKMAGYNIMINGIYLFGDGINNYMHVRDGNVQKVEDEK
jgi:hypothetical protein